MSPTLLNRLKAFGPLSSPDFNIASMLSQTGVRRLIVGCEVLLVILLTQQLARLTWQFMESSDSAMIQSWQPQSTVVNRRQSEQDAYPALNDFHLFGQEPIRLTQTDNRGIDPNAVPKSRLSAKVTGIVASSVPADSVAVIHSSGRDRTYRIGEKLQGSNAEVKDIYEDRVIVSNRGKLEALLLYPNEADRKVEKRDSSRLAEVHQQLIADPASFTDFFQITAAQKDGQLIGYQLTPGKFADVFRESGLKPDDVALSINGYDLSDSNDTMKLLQEIKQLTQLSMTIERGGRLYEIEVRL
ncbi:type II secretion system protein GspC [Endozoicomonas sp. 8E]|uniref:type II secretion system protein GspC n=1 Tax=Endozoicomonas sp. 8E TaxID=3035692 RepID=UPI00293953B7|nr:type II secretion system protein GspC [Endozoicomonas sp. 8E]WOG28327.1 type II secretion system protein GspC [Endozoicomonas sp. 8E]